MKPQPPEKLWDRVDRRGPDDCWEWQGSKLPPRRKDGQGYGTITINNKLHYTHRLAWQLTNGPIPDGMQVLHSCDNPPCCNPAHLFLGTNKDNMEDKCRKGRSRNPGWHKRTCKLGVNWEKRTQRDDRRNNRQAGYITDCTPPECKSTVNRLTPEQIAEIRSSFDGSHGYQTRMAERYGVTRQCISLILKGKTWYGPRKQRNARGGRPRKLTFEQAATIRRAYMRGLARLCELARFYNVSSGAIFNIVAGRTYRQEAA